MGLYRPIYLLFCLIAVIVDVSAESCVPLSSCSDDEIRKLSLLTNGLRSTHTAESRGCHFEHRVAPHSSRLSGDLYQSK